MTDPFDGPGSTSAIKWADHEHRLVLVWARAEKPFTFEGETKEVIQADVVVLDPPSGAPIEYKNTIVFPRVMQGQIRANIGTGRPNLGRVAQGEPKPRQNAPWVLVDPTEADKRIAVAYLANPNATPAPAGATATSGVAGSSEPPPF